jgi:diaminopimelate epimerase
MRLTKHHGLGNDFLVLLDPAGDRPMTPELVKQLCARTTGIGADGLLRATRSTGQTTAVAVMELFNADGSRAEMSGNGIRCLAQALLRYGWATPPDVAISTDAGVRIVSWCAGVDDSTDVLEVDMGPVQLGADAPEWTGGPLRRAAWADIGNPHLVVELDDEAADVDLVTLGEKVNAGVSGGANIHLVAVLRRDGLFVRTYERGVGLTEACGTGACASAAVAQRWGLVDDQVTVRMPGGEAQVTLGPTVRLTGPATVVGAIEVPAPSQGVG